ncbi:MAG: DUF2061 domain-containing protein [Sneathiellales bacterium]|nr:DUF2061 domain-containing protein [Sneathiellales bacterium]
MEQYALIKTVTFAILHVGVAFLVGYLLTGSILVGGLIALVEPVCNTAVFYLHERVWTAFSRKGVPMAG